MKDKAAVPMVIFSLLGILCGMAAADDWPTYLHDSTRSGVTTESLDLPLAEVWVYKSRVVPQPAWPAPAKQDFWHGLRELRPVVTYDRAFHAVSAGDAVFFGSSADDKVYCLDAADGSIRWTFFTDAPVRLAPTIAEGKVYFSSTTAGPTVSPPPTAPSSGNTAPAPSIAVSPETGVSFRWPPPARALSWKMVWPTTSPA